MARSMLWKSGFVLAAVLFMEVGAASAFELKVLSATVKDQAIGGAEIILQKNGETSVKSKSDGLGQVQLDRPFGGSDDASVTLIIKKEGYSNLVVKCPCDKLTYAISPTMKSLDGLRVVLNWGKSPSDLDSHMNFPGNHVYFLGKKGADANLDVDDINGFGPETITLERKHVGEKYLYAVHNFTEGATKGSASISTTSQAKVFVYIGSSLVRTFYPPKNKIGNTWVVFGIGDNGEFYDINKFADLPTRQSVGGFLDQIVSSGDLTSVPEVTVDQKVLADSLNKQGEVQYHQKNYDNAVTFYLEAINSNPEHGQAYSNLGLVYQKLNNRAEALWANRKAIALANGPTKTTIQASSHYNIARIYEDEGNWQAAMESYQLAKSLKANPAYDKGIARMKTKIGPGQ